MSLFLRGAEPGHLYSINEVVKCYLLGEGVRRNFKAAADWEEKKLVILREKSETATHEGYEEEMWRKKYAEALWECGKMYKNEGRDKKARQFYKMAEGVELARR